MNEGEGRSVKSMEPNSESAVEECSSESELAVGRDVKIIESEMNVATQEIQEMVVGTLPKTSDFLALR